MIYIPKPNLTNKQVKKLGKNTYIELVNKHYISYTKDFSNKLVVKYKKIIKLIKKG